MFTLNASYNEVAEGDTIAFYKNSDSKTGICSVKLGYSFVFKNGRFPQVYFGDGIADVNSYISGATSSKVIMCFCAFSKNLTSNFIK